MKNQNDDRQERIRASLGKINQLMKELKEQKAMQSEPLPKRTLKEFKGRRFFVRINHDYLDSGSTLPYLVWDLLEDTWRRSARTLEQAEATCDRYQSDHVEDKRRSQYKRLELVHCIITEEERLKHRIHGWKQAAKDGKANELKHAKARNQKLSK